MFMLFGIIGKGRYWYRMRKDRKEFCGFRFDWEVLEYNIKNILVLEIIDFINSELF